MRNTPTTGTSVCCPLSVISSIRSTNTWPSMTPMCWMRSRVLWAATPSLASRAAMEARPTIGSIIIECSTPSSANRASTASKSRMSHASRIALATAMGSSLVIGPLPAAGQPLGADPGGMETVGHALRHANLGDRTLADILGVEDGHERGFPFIVPHEADQVAVVLGPPVVLGRERGLAEPLADAGVVRLTGVVPQIAPGDPAEPRILGATAAGHQGIPDIAGLVALHPRIDDREFLVDDVVEDAFPGLAGAKIEAPLVEQEIVLEGRRHLGKGGRIDLAAPRAGEPERRADHHDLDPALAIVLLPGVGDMVHVGRAGLEPADLFGRAVARYD